MSIDADVADCRNSLPHRTYKTNHFTDANYPNSMLYEGVAKMDRMKVCAFFVELIERKQIADNERHAILQGGNQSKTAATTTTNFLHGDGRWGAFWGWLDLPDCERRGVRCKFTRIHLQLARDRAEEEEV